MLCRNGGLGERLIKIDIMISLILIHHIKGDHVAAKSLGPTLVEKCLFDIKSILETTAHSLKVLMLLAYDLLFYHANQLTRLSR